MDASSVMGIVTGAMIALGSAYVLFRVAAYRMERLIVAERARAQRDKLQDEMNLTIRELRHTVESDYPDDRVLAQVRHLTSVLNEQREASTMSEAAILAYVQGTPLEWAQAFDSDRETA